MQQLLLRCIFIAVIAVSCAPAGHHRTTVTNARNNPGSNTTLPVTSDTNFVNLDEQLTATEVKPLTELSRTEDGAFVLSPGLYEADFKTYCLQPGTPGPTKNDVYFQAPLEGPRKDLVQHILLNSRKKGYMDQKNVQLLLWSVVSHSDFYKLSPDVQATAVHLLTPKQIFELQGGVAGVVKTFVRAMPASGNNDFRKLLDLGVSSYETIERMAVLNTPSRILRTDILQDHWHKHEDGYFVRYIANNYKQTKVQVYVPLSLAEETSGGNFLVFDPANWMVVPANSNAQRLGIGGPVRDIIRAVIRGIPTPKGGSLPKKKKQDKPLD